MLAASMATWLAAMSSGWLISIGPGAILIYRVCYAYEGEWDRRDCCRLSTLGCCGPRRRFLWATAILQHCTWLLAAWQGWSHSMALCLRCHHRIVTPARAG